MSKTLIALCVVLLVSFTTLNIRSTRADSQQLTDPDAQTRSREIIAHLNSVIQFYRACIKPIQKAGEPNDAVYSDQAAAFAAKAAQFGLQSAKADATLISQYLAGAAGSQTKANGGEEEQMKKSKNAAEKQINTLQARVTILDKQMAAADKKQLPVLEAEKQEVQASLDLADAMEDGLQKVVGTAGSEGGFGLAMDIDKLQRSVPELQGANKIVTPPLTPMDSVRSSGVTAQVGVLLQLFETGRSLDSLIRNSGELHKQVFSLRAPIGERMRHLILEGQNVPHERSVSPLPSPSSPIPSQPALGDPSLTSNQAHIEDITSEFKVLSAVGVPLSQELIVLEQSGANLAAWRASVRREAKDILSALLLRILVIGIALGLIFAGGEVWNRATKRYVHDSRRRRQLLLVRRTVVGFLSLIVVLFGFVTQFNSLATFAGFITAGVAVGLQTILLSVAAYFLIIGRYGIKIGDRITISSVTGDVIDVGLTRFYLMELSGTGSELDPTGRIAVFSNAVLFQAGTPLYKQMPGTEYAWHELIVKLNDNANYKAVCGAIVHEVQAVYEGYRPVIEAQHRSVENWMRAPMNPPMIDSRLQFNTGTLQLWVRFPIQIKHGAETDDKLTRALFEMIANNAEMKGAIASTPSIQASIRR